MSDNSVTLSRKVISCYTIYWIISPPLAIPFLQVITQTSSAQRNYRNCFCTMVKTSMLLSFAFWLNFQALNKKEGGGKGSLGSPDGMGGDSDGELDVTPTSTSTGISLIFNKTRFSKWYVREKSVFFGTLTEILKPVKLDRSIQWEPGKSKP